MAILENFKSKEFWVNVFKLGTTFFILFVIISLVISHFASMVSGDFYAIYEDEWAEGRWQEYFGIKVAISFVYAIYMVSRKRKQVRKEE